MTVGTEQASFLVIEDALSDRYRILTRTGGKGLSSQYEAEDRTLGRTVTIKSVFFDASAGPEILELQKTRFRREAEVTVGLEHSSILPIYEVITKPASAFIVMASVDGDRLQSVLAARKRLEPFECIQVLSGIATGLDYVHKRGVIHRNVKPANIIVTPSSTALLCDFSLAQTETPSQFVIPGSVVGTPSYMSPEQARGDKVEPRSDLFSLGCVLYECLAGTKPFRGESRQAIFERVLGPEPAPPVEWERLGLPSSLERVVQQAVAKNPAERFENGAALIDALRVAVGELPSQPASESDESDISATMLFQAPAEMPMEEAEAEPPPLDPAKVKMLVEDERPLELSPMISDVLQVANMSPEEGFLLSRVDGVSRGCDIMSVSPMDEGQTARVLLGLLDRKFVRFADASVAHPEDSSNSLPRWTKGTAASNPEHDALREEVDQMIEAAKTGPEGALGVSADASSDEIKTAYRDKVLRYHPDRHATVSDPDLRDKLSHLLALASEAHTALSKKAEQRASSTTSAAPNAPPASPTSSTASATDPSHDFNGRRHAAALFRHAEQAYELQDFWQTIQLCRQAIKVCEQEPKYHYLLALCLIRNKKWRKQASYSLKKAVELDGKNPEYLAMLAVLYEAEGLRVRAEKLFAQLSAIEASFPIPKLPA